MAAFLRATRAYTSHHSGVQWCVDLWVNLSLRRQFLVFSAGGSQTTQKRVPADKHTDCCFQSKRWWKNVECFFFYTGNHQETKQPRGQNYINSFGWLDIVHWFTYCYISHFLLKELHHTTTTTTVKKIVLLILQVKKTAALVVIISPQLTVEHLLLL